MSSTLPLAWALRRRWRKIAESDDDSNDDDATPTDQLVAVARAFGTSRYTMALTATLFVTLLLTNLAEYQYSMVLQDGRGEAELAALFGTTDAASNLLDRKSGVSGTSVSVSVGLGGRRIIKKKNKSL